MKILVMGDIHGQCQNIFNYLQENKVDLIILTGDIT
ncbi:MAG: metallophosphoesterase, partial [Methanobacterium sp.]